MRPNPSIERTATGLAREAPQLIVPLRGPIRQPPLMSNVRPHKRTPRRTTMKTTTTIYILVLLAVIALVVLQRQGIFASAGGGKWPFYVRKLLSQPEQVLYHRLVRALPEHIVLAQVQVSRVLGVKKGSSFNEWNNRINRLSYDFVVCGKDSTVVAAVELDDKTHESKARAATDEKKNKASADAGLRLIRWHVASLPSEEAIRQELLTPPGPAALHAVVPSKGKSAA
jgi:hypothetical protein